jgi:hypothetical protein
MTMTTQARFAGVWTVTREIEDFATGRPGRFRGLARITALAEGLRYAEYGTLTLGTARMQATRVYLWQPEGATGVRVLFDDGRFFHRFDWGQTISTDDHQCEADHYAVRYNFGVEGWHVHWRVQGPAKDYAATTRFLRPVQGDVAAGVR